MSEKNLALILTNASNLPPELKLQEVNQMIIALPILAKIPWYKNFSLNSILMTTTLLTLTASLLLFFNEPKTELIVSELQPEQSNQKELNLPLIAPDDKSVDLFLSNEIPSFPLATDARVSQSAFTAMFLTNEVELPTLPTKQQRESISNYGSVTDDMTPNTGDEYSPVLQSSFYRDDTNEPEKIEYILRDNPVTGKVFAFKDTPVMNIKVTAKKSKKTVLTDENGNFTIECDKNDKLVFEGSGFRKEVVKVVEGQILKVKLLFLTGEKNEEALVGAGHMSKESLFFSKSNFLEYNNDFHTYQDVFMLIAGKFPGVKIYNELGFKRVVIRDISYLSGRDNTALYLVDGQIWQDISVLVPEEIVSIDVLKDGSPLGFRAVNGVVVISTVAHANKSGGN